MATTFFIIYGGIAIFGVIVVVLDTLARRHDARTDAER
jgi:hypothetical protein